MRRRTPWITVTLLVGIPAFFAGTALWPPVGDIPQPTPALGALMTAAAFAKALCFGAGCAFVLFGWPTIRAMERRTALWALALYASIAWLLLSWWPASFLHDAPERAGEPSLAVLLLHLSVIAATLIVAQRFLRTVVTQH